MFSRSCEYAILSVIYIAFHQHEGYVGIRQISKTQHIPIHYLSKILGKLVKSGLLHSFKGPGGGFKLNVPAGRITLYRIVEEVDGLGMFDRCSIGLKKCEDSNPCPLHFEYKEIKQKTKDLLRSKTLKSICLDIAQGKSSLIGYRK